jgi:hypothetical protein
MKIENLFRLFARFSGLAPLLLCAGIVFGQKQIFWTNTDTGTIQRANLDGSGSVTVLSGLTVPLGLDVDVAGGKIYWTENIPGSDTGKIRRANLDGTDIQDLVMRNQTPDEVVVDRVHNKIWWSESRDVIPSRIARSNFDGSGVEEIHQRLDGHVNNIRDLFLDLERNHMYWGNPGPDKIQRASLTATNVTDLPITVENPRSIEIDLSTDRIYWIEDRPDAALRGIRRAFLDGTSNQQLVVGLSHPHGLALDLEGGKFYWSEDFAIRRANLDGSSPELVFSRPGEKFGGDIEIVIVPEPSIVAPILIGIGAAAVHRRKRHGR